MAFVVPLTTYGFISSKPRTFFEEVYRRQLAVKRFSTSVTKSMNLAGSNYSDGGILTMKRSYFCKKTTTKTFSTEALSRNFCQPISHYFSVRFSAYVVISGFWEGPDTEDGWGFVEAFVCQI